MPWHQDGRYWPIHPPASCSVWVAVDEADEANGAIASFPAVKSLSCPPPPYIFYREPLKKYTVHK